MLYVEPAACMTKRGTVVSSCLSFYRKNIILYNFLNLLNYLVSNDTV